MATTKKPPRQLSTGRTIKAATQAMPYAKDSFGPPPAGSTKERTSGPPDELGKLGQFSSATTTSWNALITDEEYVPELLWPRSIKVYNGMRNDPQIAGLLRGSTLPIRQYHWYVDDNGADLDITKMIAEDFGLPLKDESNSPRKRSQGRFRWDNHLRMALEMSMIFGHMFFEQVGQYDAQGYWRMRKLAERMPNTIVQFGTDDNGSLAGIKQNFAGAPWIPINRMVGYIHDQEGGNWVGRSHLRSLYQPWLLKDRLLRVDVTRHERNGAGMPIVELPPGATRRQRTEAAALAQMYRVGQGAGGALPAGMKLTLLGVQGNVSDTLASIRFHNEEMSRSWLMMFMQLGQTQSGSRALGAEFLDFFALSQEALANWAMSIINEYMVEDWVDWNVGPDAPVPLIKYRRTEANNMSAENLAKLVQYGAIQVDTDLEKFLREYYQLPAPGGTPIPTGTRQGTLAPVVPGQAQQPQLPPAGESTVSARSSSHPGQAHSHAVSLPPGGVEAAASGRGDGSWPFRRQPTTEELAAATDFPKLDAQWSSALGRLEKKWQGVTAVQIEQLVQQIEAAVTPEALQQIFATPEGQSLITDEMIKLIDKGAALAEAEAKSQGVDIKANTVVLDTEKIVAEQRAANVDRLLADALKQSALAKAMQVSPNGGGGPDVAAKVEAHLMSLKGAFVHDQLGGALTTAQNGGRRAVFEAALPGGVKLYASELLDNNTCGPCADEDGKEFGTLEAARAEYSSGGYDNCEGGPRCRGTIVAVYEEAQ